MRSLERANEFISNKKLKIKRFSNTKKTIFIDFFLTCIMYVRLETFMLKKIGEKMQNYEIPMNLATKVTFFTQPNQCV